MQISGRTRVFMVVADPVAQVQAPAVFNALFQRHAVDAVLVPAHVAAADFAGFARHVLAARNIDGLWLTIPHKTAAVALLDRCDAAGRAARAVNALRREADGTLSGGLFDGLGFVAALRQQGFAPRGRRVLLVGTGGAGVAIAAALVDAGVGALALFDAAPGRAAEVAGQLARPGAAAIALPASADPAGFDLVVNCTPLGLDEHDPLPFDVARVDAGARVVDILMKPAPTPLLRECTARGLLAHPGFEMLVQQVPAYLDFFGLTGLAAAVRDDLAAVRALLQRR
ncbi:MAG: shikimate dehydrogenase [Burkholderiaceae bacterium]|nr:shikimate dehydrogenase [Burkholderiaceae bacterium]